MQRHVQVNLQANFIKIVISQVTYPATSLAKIPERRLISTQEILKIAVVGLAPV
jgi:hypothetical protein